MMQRLQHESVLTTLLKKGQLICKKYFLQK